MKRSVFIVVCALLVPAAAASLHAQDRTAVAATAVHPMDSLTAAEIEKAAKILRASGRFTNASKLVSLSLVENDKAEVRSWTPGKPFARRAFGVVLTQGKLAEARIDLDADKLASWTAIENRQAAITLDEFMAAGDIVKADQRWRDAASLRSTTSPASP